MAVRAHFVQLVLGAALVWAQSFGAHAADNQTTTSALAPTSAQSTACSVDPLQGRALYLRGSFNSWAALESQRFDWVCNRYELVTTLRGAHQFKIGDEAWSADADWGIDPQAPTPSTPSTSTVSTNTASNTTPSPDALVAKGREIRRTFSGVHRLRLTPASNAEPARLAVESCPNAAPLGEQTLYLRGSMNNWAALDSFALQYRCDAYYVNIDGVGTFDFKIADAAWSPQFSLGVGEGGAGADTGAGGDAPTPTRTLVLGGQGNLRHTFAGKQTLRLELRGTQAWVTIGAQALPDARREGVDDVLANSLRFDSRDAAFKRPFGAVAAGSAVDFVVTSLSGVEQLTLVVEERLLQGNQDVLEYHPLARIAMQQSPATASDGSAQLRWQARYNFANKAVYGYWFEAQVHGHTFVLHNNRDSIFWTREKGSGGHAVVDALPTQPSAIRRFRQTVFDPAYAVPEWAADAVFYAIFPERFRNGNRANDPKPGVRRYHQGTVELHQRWGEPPFRPESGDGSDGEYNNDFFGGDLAGITEKLDYIAQLGANTIYMTPIFQAASNHKYDTADYQTIDPAFGSNADFERLTSAAAAHGIRVVVDTSLNHTGADSVYFNRYGNFDGDGGVGGVGGVGAFQNGHINPQSPYANWYSFDATQSQADKQYKGWVDIADLPEINKADAGFRDFAYRAPHSVMKQWLERGASGWRMDVAPWVADDFWREWRSHIKQHSPQALTVAETWFDASKFLLGDMFDSTMNYILRDTVLAYAGGGNAAQLYPNIELTREAYPPQAFYALMNLISSHDVPRALYVLGATDSAGQTGLALAKQRLRLATFFQMTFPGAPSVYYGDEVAVNGAEDPYNRATYPWPDRGGTPDLAMQQSFTQLIALRKQHPVLRRGSIDAPIYIDAHSIVWLRRLGKQSAIVACNNSDKPVTVALKLPADAGLDSAANAGVWSDALGGASVAVDNGQLRLEIPALFGRVLLRSQP